MSVNTVCATQELNLISWLVLCLYIKITFISGMLPLLLNECLVDFMHLQNLFVIFRVEMGQTQAPPTSKVLTIPHFFKPFRMNLFYQVFVLPTPNHQKRKQTQLSWISVYTSPLILGNSQDPTPWKYYKQDKISLKSSSI